MKKGSKKSKKNEQPVYQLVEIQKLSYKKMIPLMKSCFKEMERAAGKILAALGDFPTGRLRVSPHRGSYQYFHVAAENSKAGSRGTYIPKAQRSLACELAQKSYNETVADLLARGAATLENALHEFEHLKIEKIIDAQGPGRCPLISPVYLSDAAYANRWQKVEYQGKFFNEDDALLITAKGERVRSKSEVIIANMLNQLKVPYRYEYPLQLSSGRVIYPDFTCLNVRTRDEFIWEHFGRMNDADYQTKTFKKLDGYALDGYVHGVNLIYTMENDLRPVNPQTIEILVKQFLL